MIPELSSVLSLVKTAKYLTQDLREKISERIDLALQEQLCKLMDTISALHLRVLDLQELVMNLKDENQRLKSEIAKAEQWNNEKEQYVLAEIIPG
ncbi:hypothetical protein, partial [Thermodesulfatator autotrophicus]|uniref:hypothetical protein n=1 Tax=Thermodesulfatator autotrophicus TaxID=1795632 RepID=UPI0012F9015C